MVDKWYYYLHENGDLIGKSPAAIDSIGPYDYLTAILCGYGGLS